MEVTRQLQLLSTLEQKSCFLYGARQTGKTTLIQQELPEQRLIQLLDLNIQRRLLQNPMLLEEMISEKDKIVVIDEIQKIPELLDVVHLLIEKKKIRFLLTGSNSRKLKRSGVNLLGGRARVRHLFPLITRELKENYNLEKAAQYGLLPSIYFSEDPVEDLRSYVSEYLIQEIAAEGISRNIPAFGRFMEVAALCNGQILNYAQIGSDAEVKRGTVKNYFDILEDTLIGFRLNAWKKGKDRKAISAEKFYFFDSGVVNSLCGRKSLSLQSVEGGSVFETLVMHEVRSWNEYQRKDVQLSYWKSTSGFEVDLLMGDSIGIEIKAKQTVSERDLKGLRALADEKRFKKYYLVYLGSEVLNIGNVEVLPFQEFVQRLWGDLI